MWDQLSFVISQLRERLWIKPLGICVLSIIAVFLASLLDMTDLGRFLPEFSKESTDALLKIMASSMLVMATFSVGSMVSAYASASSSATPRSFPLIIADDVSQNAPSAFIGAFIYSVVAIVALTNGHFEGKASLFVLFVLTMTFSTSSSRWICGAVSLTAVSASECRTTAKQYSSAVAWLTWPIRAPGCHRSKPGPR